MEENFSKIEQEECMFIMAQDLVFVLAQVATAIPELDNFITADKFKFNL